MSALSSMELLPMFCKDDRRSRPATPSDSSTLSSLEAESDSGSELAGSTRSQFKELEITSPSPRPSLSASEQEVGHQLNLEPDRDANLRASLLLKRDYWKDHFTLEGCLSIIKVLQNPPPDQQIVRTITAKQLSVVLTLGAEDKRFRIRAKFFYHPETNAITIMSPYPIHEVFIVCITDPIGSFVQQIDYEGLKVLIQGGARVYTYFSKTYIVPDTLVSLARIIHNKAGPDKMQMVGECGFSSSYSSMLERLKTLAAENASLDLVFIVSIEETRFLGPGKDSEAARTLLTQPKLEDSRFFSRPEECLFGPVNVGGTVWINITKIQITVFVRDTANGHFDFDLSHSANSTNMAQGTLYPTMNTTSIDALFQRGAQKLKSTIVEEMKILGADKDTIDFAVNSTPRLNMKWKQMRDTASWATSKTAYQRYRDWYEKNQNGDHLEPL
ncbi:hypothetical protein BJ138DRAFT_1228843 [Hygrophoropsis aurantiaca]|uniref:Uncharacterized protein n=1 Tax=Hygrophoropsis aurantiaca TaxID=72124 RepID=A0ACB7ZXS2_9AGAM|nr:hypothetical protein BJ138DRAFT_1228843 [Hygrophoropsis aurantiaca]